MSTHWAKFALANVAQSLRFSRTRRLPLHEQWQWTNGDLSEGQSIVEELKS
jgi:hypothetical protein